MIKADQGICETYIGKKNSSRRFYGASAQADFNNISLHFLLYKVSHKKVGIDVGIKDLFVASDGFKSGNPRHTAKYAAKLAKYQRRLAKKKLGGKNRQKAKLKVARIHAKISDCRLDNLHQLSRKLINEK